MVTWAVSNPSQPATSPRVDCGSCTGAQTSQRPSVTLARAHGGSIGACDRNGVS